ncbi:MAG: L,D-transpeptidase family protein [Methylovulum sp.]|uniref:L,D-transpeptidase family protein n=1 Tax=Methylovulum sp. TaxID=1916980 RepID=UPI00261E2A29|nr:L,D-transpeptidase family protein [Methylovulum sp.]MDD2723356.1 L,D-transpeptidase family protein [Methylovulum sp.]MDD5125333.1 L,D-transpeptidase family protein [Methylovulum sp.]
MKLNTLINIDYYGPLRLTGKTPMPLKKSGPFTSWLNRVTARLFMFICLGLSAETLLAEQTIAGEPSPIAKEISAIIASKQHPFLQPGNFSNRSEDLDALYKLGNYQLLWLGTEASENNIAAMLELLENAGVHGLQKNHYDADALQNKLPAILHSDTSAYRELASYDTALSLSLLRFLHDLHYGRVSPQVINFNLKLREKKLLDLPALIKTSIERQTVKQLPDLVEPQLRQYQLLKTALANYRELAQTIQPFSLVFKKTIRPGETLPEINALRDYLMALGDMAKAQKPANDAKSTRYGDETVAAMKKFQRRHGLSADGVIGKSTVVELNTGIPKRAAQIELAMERLRWLPELSSDPSIIVNIPAFHLWALNDVNNLGSNITQMRVVVGKAMKNQTPVLMANMSFIDFSPYWNVPYNIVKDEIIPKLSYGPGYLAKENMELVGKNGVVGFSESTMGQLKQGTLRVRQKPGKKNALGRVKFLFPNKDDVYLHDTPANALFSRSRRDFSHGCVRVDDPEALAEFALRNQPGWDKAKIQLAMKSPKMQRVILKKPIPVLFFYSTAFFDHDDQLVFYADIYDHDTVLQEALKNTEDLSDQMLFVNANNQYKIQELPALPAVEPIKTVGISK